MSGDPTTQRESGVHGHYVDGEFRAGDGDTFESLNPATGDTIGTFRRGTKRDVRAATEAAERAFEERRGLSYIDRA